MRLAIWPQRHWVPFFSVIIATRNRPEQFRHALDSVLRQSCSDTEVVVVNDGSDSEHQFEYESIFRSVDPVRLRLVTLCHSPNGHGGGYARNFGAANAIGPYLCFLDDDDCWTDSDHLQRAKAVIEDADAVDLYMTNQAAFFRGERKPGPIWIEDLPGILARLQNWPDHRGIHTVTVDELLKSRGFCHLNGLIVRKALYEEIGGMEEAIRWEEDRDFYLRLIDRATVVKYAPITIARHNIPDPAKKSSLTTSLSELQRRLFQIMVLDRALCFARHPAIRSYARRHKAYALRRVAEALAAEGRYAEAALYAGQAFSVSLTVKWAGYSAWLTLRSKLSKCSTA